jgi:hypothetical protein
MPGFKKTRWRGWLNTPPVWHSTLLHIPYWTCSKTKLDMQFFFNLKPVRISMCEALEFQKNKKKRVWSMSHSWNVWGQIGDPHCCSFSLWTSWACQKCQYPPGPTKTMYLRWLIKAQHVPHTTNYQLHCSDGETDCHKTDDTHSSSNGQTRFPAVLGDHISLQNWLYLSNGNWQTKPHYILRTSIECTQDTVQLTGYILSNNNPDLIHADCFHLLCSPLLLKAILIHTIDFFPMLQWFKTKKKKQFAKEMRKRDMLDVGLIKLVQ